MKILMSGGIGNLASQIVKHNTDHEIYSYSKKELNVTNIDSVISLLRLICPDVFIHAGALTRPMKKHIDDPYNSINSNIVGTANVVKSCLQYNRQNNKNILVVYISTDYVYPGEDGNYDEESPLLPVNEYAWSKLGGECCVKLYKNHLILRAAISEYPFPHKKALDDIRKSYMYNYDVAKIILKLITLDSRGTINIGGPAKTPYKFASEYFNVEKAYTSEISDVKLAHDSSMNTSKLKGILQNE